MRKRDDGFLRYEIKLVRQDGSARLIEREATPHQCTMLERRHKKLVKLGDTSTLQFRVSKVL